LIRRVLSKCLIVAPPAWWMAGFLAVFAIGEGWYRLLDRNVGGAGIPHWPGRTILYLGSIVLGFYRVVGFHPFFRANYRRWLMSTPWDVRKPLPLGPIELVPQDAVALGILILLGMYQGRTRSLGLINTFLFTHILFLVATFWKTRVPGFGYVSAMLLGFAPRVWSRPWITLGLLAGIYLLAREGLWRALARFPWTSERFPAESAPGRDDQADLSCGWPFDRFHRDISATRRVNVADAVLGCMLGGWWLYNLASLIPAPDGREAILTIALCSSVLISVWARLMLYTSGYRPPMSAWGRIRTLRWIIPGYDQVFVGPLLTLIAGPLALLALRPFGLDFEIRLSFAVGLVVFVALVAPPGLRHWRLTGRHRLGATFSES
jgi:hypothetical protein